MKPIKDPPPPPIGPNSNRDAIVNLQDALFFLLERQVIRLSDDERVALLRDRDVRVYGEGMFRTIRAVRAQLQMEPGEIVDAQTARILNRLLDESGAFDAVPAEIRGVVAGQVRREDNMPLKGVSMRAIHESELGPVELGEDTSDADGRYTIRYQSLPGMSRVNLRVVAVGEDERVLILSELIDQAKPFEIVDLVIPITIRPAPQRRIDGHVVLDHGLPAEQFKLRLYRRDFGGQATLLSETRTLSGGQYTFTCDAASSAGSLEIRALSGENNETLLTKPFSFVGRQPQITLDLAAPRSLQPLAGEFNRLSADIAQQLGQTASLSGAKENDGRQDITVLNRITGWDARLIALAAMSERLSADPEVPLPPEAVYGLLRAGLPTDKLLLAQVEPDVAEQALKKVRDAGIVELSDEQIGQLKRRFAAFGQRVRLSLPAPGSRSTYGQLLKASGLSDDAQARFASVYFDHRGNGNELWERARQAGLDDAQLGKLKLQGKLAFLAGNSEAMTARLMQKQINDPVQLAEQDFHRPDSWIKEIFDQANVSLDRRGNLTDVEKTKLDVLVPAAYTGQNVEDRLESYAEDMARKVRLSYPTQLIQRMIEDGTIEVSQARDATARVLKSAVRQGFRLGQTPVAAFLKTHLGVTDGMAEKDVQAAEQQLKTLQRLYQITPTNEAIPVLKSLGITSAYDVMAYSEEQFTILFALEYEKTYGKAPTAKEPKLVYRKAKQISSVTYNLFGIATKLNSEPSVAGISAPIEVRESVRNELIKQFPTMEALFGSMDFCECEHCRSVLSPAAYFVDLLQFIDPESGEWGNFLARWKATHANQDYPHQDASGNAQRPYGALLERRPDLPHIPLTCENTHTALPYIDIVNEILEYYVANGKLAEQAAQDTGSASTAELLAEPQHVIREAYDRLREARYPLHLPFDLWIEAVRRFCEYFETPLARVLEVFRRSDDLFSPAQPFDRCSIFIESLRLSPSEAAIFTDPAPLADDKWHELYGLPTSQPVIQNPTNVQHAALTVANGDSQQFRPGFVCTYFDVSANALSLETRNIATIGPPNSGGAGQTLITFTGVWTAAPEAGDRLVCSAAAMLKSAKTLARRLDVTYHQIAEIVQSGFINPELPKLGVLYKLGVTVRDARLYQQHKPFYEQNKDLVGKDRNSLSLADQQRFDGLSDLLPNTQMSGWDIVNELAAFEQRLNHLAAALGTPFDRLQTSIQDIPIGKVLVLADPDAGCNFDLTTLQYADGAAADPIVFLRINLFVRLWRKLGWTIEETDRALCTFVPQSAPFDAPNLVKQPLQTALIYLAHLKSLDEKVRVGKQSRLKLLTLWSDIATTGKNPLYAQHFLTPSMLKSDSVFDHSLGKYLAADALAEIAAARKHTVQLGNVSPANKIDPALFAAEPKIEVSYDELHEVQQLSFQGTLSDAQKAALVGLSPSPALPPLLDAVQVKAQEFLLIKGHMLALQGALGLTAEDIRRILEDAGKSLDTETLSLPAVSLLFRYGLLAKALKLSVRELIALKQLSALDPFRALHPDPLLALSEDHPFSQTLRFVEVAEAVQQSGLAIDDLDYLLRHRFDETGKYRPNRRGALTLIKTLAEGIRAIRAEHAAPHDAGVLNEETLRQKLGLVLPPDVVERFVAMMNGTAEFTATAPGVAPDAQLKPEQFANEPAIREVRYNSTRQEQRLTFRGAPLDPELAALKARLPKPTSPNPHVPSPLLTALLDDIRSQAHTFFDRCLLKRPTGVQPVSGFLEPEDFDLLFKPIPAGLTEGEQQEHLRQQRSRLARAYLPFLQERLIRRFIVQTLAAQTAADPLLIESLLADERLLTTANSAPLLSVFAEAGEDGPTRTHWFSADRSGVALISQPPSAGAAGSTAPISSPFHPVGTNRVELHGFIEVPSDDDYEFSVVLAKQDDTVQLRIGDQPQPALEKVAAHDGEEVIAAPLALQKGVRHRIQMVVDGFGAQQARLTAKSAPLPKAGCNSACLEGYLEVPAAGAYRFLIALEKQNAEAELRFDHLPDPVFLKGAAAADHAVRGDQADRFLELKPGILYRFTLELRELSGGEAQLLVMGESLPQGPVNRLKLYPRHAVAAAEHAVTLMSKVMQLVQSLGLSEREIRYLLVHAAAFGGLNLNDLPSQRVGDTPADTAAAATRFSRFLRLAAYARLKRELAGGTDDLVDIFEANDTAAADKLEKKVYPLLARLMRRDEATVKAAATALFAAPAFNNEQALERLWDALQVVERFGVPVPAVVAWTVIVSAAPASERFEIARGLKETLKARFEAETWQRVAQPIFDQLRKEQRDALAAYVMHQHGFARIEQLYEYFLIDPGMEPVVQTSRIRLAIASVQLFIQRCLLNMELKVHPSAIHAKQWEWMKRYRVWEANRKIFLFPENWLEPEFRDDKSHLFSELEGNLMQGDLSSDLVDEAFLNYLKKLDELARLDIVAMHLEDHADPARRIVHVFGRTFSEPHKYFYRRYAHQVWTPWEPVTAEIEGHHLAPVVWRDRLYLFWVTIVKTPKPKTGSTPVDPTKSFTIPEVETQLVAQLHWSEYLQGQWNTRESGEIDPPESQKLTAISADPRQVFIHVSKEYDADGEEGGVHIHLSWPFNRSFYLASRNSAPALGAYGGIPAHPYTPAYSMYTAHATRYPGAGPFKVNLAQRITTTEAGWSTGAVQTLNILQQGGSFVLLPCNNNLTALGASEDVYQNAANPAAVKEAIESGLEALASLMKPVFYQDGANAFFVEPSVTETTIEDWQDWVTHVPQPDPGWSKPVWWKDFIVVSEIPWKRPIPEPGDPWRIPIDDRSLVKPMPDADWLVNPATGLLFDGVLIGPAGAMDAKILQRDATGLWGRYGIPIHVNPGSGVAANGAVVLTDAAALDGRGQSAIAGGVNVVGSSGFNSALAESLLLSSRGGFGARSTGAAYRDV